MRKYKRYLMLLGLISTLSLGGCGSEEISMDQPEKIEFNEPETSNDPSEITESSKEERTKEILAEYMVNSGIEDIVCFFTVVNPINESCKSYIFEKDMEFKTESKDHPEDSTIFDDISNVLERGHLDISEENILNVEVTLVNYKSSSSNLDKKFYGEKHYKITYNDKGEIKIAEIHEQNFSDTNNNTSFYSINTMFNGEVACAWIFLDNEDYVFLKNKELPLKKYTANDIMEILLDNAKEEKGEKLGLKP